MTSSVNQDKTTCLQDSFLQCPCCCIGHSAQSIAIFHQVDCFHVLWSATLLQSCNVFYAVWGYFIPLLHVFLNSLEPSRGFTLWTDSVALDKAELSQSIMNIKIVLWYIFWICCSLDKKRKGGGGAGECAVEVPANRTLSLQIEPEENLHVLQNEPILIQETPRTQVHDSQTAVTVQVIGFMPYPDT